MNPIRTSMANLLAADMDNPLGDHAKQPLSVRTALLHNSTSGQASPDPRRSYATATVWGVPSSVN